MLCWQRARQWSKQIFELSESKLFARDQRLVVQINDSSESVMSNFAEGFGRGTQAEFITFLGYALGSLDETKSHLCAAYDRKYLSKDEFAAMFSEGTEIRKMTVGLIQSMIKPGGDVKFIQKYKSWTEDNWERYDRITGKQRPEFFRNRDKGGPVLLAKDSFAKDGEADEKD
ncbi:MAG: four helix bundle protein [Planctomycetales bacterium]|nr:four helix bundle protein [Planctomycetales bacterium]